MQTSCSATQGGRVLVIESGLNDIQCIVALLRANGYAPHVATPPGVAFEALRESLPHLILLGAEGPDIDGYETCRQLKTDPRTKDVPVIFMSADDRPGDRVRAFSAGAVDCITKPFQPAEALARIGTHVALRRMALSLAEAKEHAERASLAKSLFLAGMSHELRTPLNAILGYARILAFDQMGELEHRGLDAIHDDGEKLLRLIDDLLELSRIEAGKLQLMPAVTAVASVIASVSRIVGPQAARKGLGFDCEVDADVPAAIVVDDKRLRQVLLHLLGNAVAYTGRGRVRLHVQRRPGGDEGEACLRFCVDDTGPGIGAADLAALFHRLGQAGDMAHRPAGPGLGLAISRQLVRLMDSDIRVQSEPGAGSRFWFDLRVPLAQPPQQPAAGMAAWRGDLQQTASMARQAGWP